MTARRLIRMEGFGAEGREQPSSTLPPTHVQDRIKNHLLKASHSPHQLLCEVALHLEINLSPFVKFLSLPKIMLARV